MVERSGWRLLRIQGSHHIYGKGRQHHAAVDSDSWQQGAEDRAAAASAQGRRDRRE